MVINKEVEMTEEIARAEEFTKNMLAKMQRVLDLAATGVPTPVAVRLVFGKEPPAHILKQEAA